MSYNVIKEDIFFLDNPYDYKLTEFIGWLNAALEQVPDNYKEAVIIEFEASEFYDSIDKSISVYYWREMTEEEKMAEEKRLDEEKENKKRRELQILEALKKKYEDVN